MSGLSDMLQGIEDWAKSIPSAAKTADEATGRWMASIPGAVGTLYDAANRQYMQNVAGPSAHWAGLYNLAKRDEAGKSTDPGGTSDSGQLPVNEIEIGGKKYTFKAFDDPYGQVQDYTAQGQTGPLPLTKADMPYMTVGKGKNRREVKLPLVDQKPVDGGTLGQIGDPATLTPKEYDLLTHQASKGNKLAQRILVRGHYKAHPYPSLQQDIAKLEDPFVQAMSNLPNVAQSAEAQAAAVTKPYDFSNAMGQVNNILANQGFAAVTPSAQTSAYVAQQDAAAASAPTINTVGPLGAALTPSISQALSTFGPAGKAYEAASPYTAFLNALLSHLQYSDIYQQGLSSASTQGDPAWLQNMLAAVVGAGGSSALPLPTAAAAGTNTASVPSATPSTIPNTG